MGYPNHHQVGQRSLANLPIPPPEPGDRILEAARTQLFWILTGPADGPWRLRQLDDTTGQLRDDHGLPATPPAGATRAEAITWAGQQTGVHTWTGVTSPEVGIVEQAYQIVRELAYTPRTGRTRVLTIEPEDLAADTHLVVLRERWDATGALSDPMFHIERRHLSAAVDEMLATISDWHRLDPASWREIQPGAEYHHP